MTFASKNRHLGDEDDELAVLQRLAVTYLVPARYYLVILRGVILKGAGLAPYWQEFLALVVFALATVTLASFRLARREA